MIFSGSDTMIDIISFGEFDIKNNGESILEEIGSQNRLLLLLKYFLTYKGKRLRINTIVEDLMEDKDLKEPLKVVRTQISRLRKLFHIEFYSIEFSNGYYVFDLHDNCNFDMLIFESNMNTMSASFDGKDSKQLELLKETILLYKGIYFSEVENDDWLIPTRNRLDRIYLKGLSSYLASLKKKGLHHEIIDICEKAIQIKPYEEFINKYFMDALVEVGQKRYALSHYEYYTSKLYNDLRMIPTQDIKEVYKEIKSSENDLKKIIDLNIIDKELENTRYSKGALICDFQYFRFLYNLEIRNKDRNSNRDIFLGIISLDSIGYTPLSKEDIKKGMNELMIILYNKLRKTDVISKWNDSQLLLLLYDLRDVDLNTVSNRLQERFKQNMDNKDMVLNIKLKPL